MTAAFDSSIPVLTEVFKDDAPPPVDYAPAVAAAAVSAAPAVWRIGPAQQAPASAPAPAPVPQPPAPEDWAGLEQRLNERILKHLTAHIDQVLEQRIRGMEAVLAHTLAGLVPQLRAGLEDTLAHVVAQAVTQEIGRQQAPKE